MQQILIIEDDRALNQGLCKALKTDNNSMQVCSGLYASATDRQIVSCENLKDAKEQLLCGMPSLILLDINLPDGSGLDFLQSVKMECPDCPVILLTANDTDGDIVNGLELGADDYITKPFNILEVKARIKAILRRSGKKAEPVKPVNIMEINGMKVELDSRRVFVHGKELNLTAKEFDLLELLMAHPNKVYSRNELLDTIWGSTYPGDARTVDVHVRRLREKIEDNPGEPVYIHTKWGVGYYFKG